MVAARSWARGLRAVAAFAATTVATVTLAACGQVAFVPASLSPRDITVIYSVQEDVTVLRWRLSGTTDVDDTTFEWLGEDGAWHVIDFAASVFQGGQVTCGDRKGRCAQFVMPGHYQPPEALTIMRGRHPHFGVFPGGKATTMTMDTTLRLRAFFEKGNERIHTELFDAIGGDDLYRFARPVQWGLWERIAACVPGFHPGDVAFAVLKLGSASLSSPGSLSREGRYCAAARALTTAEAPGAESSVALDTWPEVTNGNHLFKAPVAVTPFSYQIVLDLTIPVKDRCSDTIAAIEKTIDGKLAAVSPVRKLPTVNLGEDEAGGSHCHGSPERTLAAIDLADAVKAQSATWPELHQRFHLLYFNNLAAPLPAPLLGSLSDFVAALAAPPRVMDFDEQLWLFGPGRSDGLWTRTWPWVSAPDPDFDKSFATSLKEDLPLASEIHDPALPVPLLTDAEAVRWDGGFIRICRQAVAPADGSGGVKPAHHDAGGALVPYPEGTLTWPVQASDPPVYLVAFPPVVNVPKPSLEPHTLRLAYEVCSRYCDHAFTASTGAAEDAWVSSSACVNADALGGP